ncbi:MAG TPA: Uma2 family endonuclease [Planctomycetota bacterium]|nr:Uma2 family endonuclease [Planctomycetota bacterium]
MSSTILETPTLQTGERLTRDEFIKRWEAQPELRWAELIGGVVYLRMPTTEEHGGSHDAVAYWLKTYALATPGCKTNLGSSWYMRDDMPQPENSLRILPEYGGQSSLLNRKGRHYLVGAPELAAEVSISSRAYDMKEKKELYRKVGVQEFISVQPEKNSVVWYRLRQGAYAELKSKEGILRSEVFPGLWLDAKAILKDDMQRVLAVLNDGLNSAEHAEFVARLAAKKK